MIVWDLHFDGKNNWFKKGFPAPFECKARSDALRGNEGISWTAGHGKSVLKDTELLNSNGRPMDHWITFYHVQRII